MKKSTANRDKELLSLWRERPIEQRTSNDVMSFYSYIQKNCPDLFNGIHGDPYQYLNGLLRQHFHDKP
ncbi:MAG: hypothetical protein HY204_12170 [Nitrospirae bacterium]|nr:hypothetical protein [Nitrospirota bacterium]